MATLTAPLLALIVGIPVIMLAWFAYEVTSFDAGTITGSGGSS
ncbi:MAG: hypothetical protein ABEJ67_06540 [Halanaeroarchaeum sp.]